jgi:hypothetical protein
MLPPGLVSGGLAVLTRGQWASQAFYSNVINVQPIFKHGTILCCWAEPRVCCIPLLRGREQHSTPIFYAALINDFF